ncbi:A24 family peptidase [Azohydromonas lata]|uniref:A24 family peptidase n=1 Tax=Azohydromonas lata TaxID=45677 RepID=A0ABU5IIN0_9BURK|nr:A24 family peptidase [Azohydromonas lata]MDZ5458858.1 A24 family peptidase [Azohydromonas lata]
MSLQLLSLSFLAALLLAAVACDLHQRRIPNALVLYGMALGLAFQAFAAAGQGLLQDGSQGVAAALLGGVAGLALFLPFYALRMLGAGDVKLLAMVGVWLGATAVLQVALWTVLAGALLSLGVMLATGSLRTVGRNLRTLFTLASLRCASGATPQGTAATGRLPYGLAIAAGSGVEMARLLLSA